MTSIVIEPEIDTKLMLFNKGDKVEVYIKTQDRNKINIKSIYLTKNECKEIAGFLIQFSKE